MRRCYTPLNPTNPPKMVFFRRLTTLFALLVLLIGWASSAMALTPLFDGGFESGTLQGWTPSASGSAIVASRATCFSDHDTTALNLRGRFAGLLRSGKNIIDDQPASFTSKAFIAGSGIVFLALSEQRGGVPKINPYALHVSVLDAAGNELQTLPYSTALAQLSEGCPSSTGDASFSQHFVSTHKFSGQQIKLRFSHHPDLAKDGAFTLIDEVSVIEEGETPIFQSYPIAKAGFQYDSSNTQLFLSAELPDGDIEQTQNWQFSWLINGESSRRPFFNPCINDLEPGDYTANLYVRQNNLLVTDTLHFSVPYIIFSTTAVTTADTSTDDASNSAETDENSESENDTSTQSQVCDFRHPLDVPGALTDDGNAEDPDDGTSSSNDTPNTAPSLAFTLNGVTAPLIDTPLFSDVVVTSDDNIASVTVTLSNLQTGDKLVPPLQSDLQGLEIGNCTDTICTITGDASSATFENVLQAFNINLINNESARTISLVATDAGGLSSASSLSQLTVSFGPTISSFTLADISVSTITTLIDTLTISSTTNLDSASITILAAQPTDQLAIPGGTELNGIADSCLDNVCTLTGEASVANYSTILEAITVELDPATDERTIKLTVKDTANITENAFLTLTPQ